MHTTYKELRMVLSHQRKLWHGIQRFQSKPTTITILYILRSCRNWVVIESGWNVGIESKKVVKIVSRIH